MMKTWAPGLTLDTIERQATLEAFDYYRGNKTATANALGINIRTLERNLERYEQERQDEEKRNAEYRRRNEEYLARARGIVPDGQPAGAGSRTGAPQSAAENAGDTLHGADSGVHLESSSAASEEPAMSVSERDEVQEVLPSQAAQGRSRKRR
jgi:hypothetical protein